jgi:hypothetical protein
MKTQLKAIACALLVLATCSIGWWTTGQGIMEKPVAATNYTYGLDELSSFSAYLEKEKLTNVTERFNAFECADAVSSESAQIGIISHVLVDLRRGQTNDAIKLLETDLAGDAAVLVSNYRELPDRIRQKVSLHSLRDIQYYSTNYGFVKSDPWLLDEITNALKLVSEPKKK